MKKDKANPHQVDAIVSGSYKFIHFVEIEKKAKTSVWSCRNNRSNEELGTVYWYGAWRQYCFSPNIQMNIVYSKGCMDDIGHFISRLRRHHRFIRWSDWLERRYMKRKSRILVLTCKHPDNDCPKLICGYPLPCPWHTAIINLGSKPPTITIPITSQAINVRDKLAEIADVLTISSPAPFLASGAAPC